MSENEIQDALEEDVADQLFEDSSMQKSIDEEGNPTDANLIRIFNASEKIEPIVRKSIMKKPGTPVPGTGTVLGKRSKNN